MSGCNEASVLALAFYFERNFSARADIAVGNLRSDGAVFCGRSAA